MLAGVEVVQHPRVGAEVHSSAVAVDRASDQVVDHLVGNTERTLVLATP